MKNSYLNNVPITHGEVTVVISSDAESLLKHSCKLANSASDAGLGTLLINCGMSERRFREHLGYPETKKRAMPFISRTSHKGDLIGERVGIDQCIEEAGIRVVIISGWEWTSSSYRRKERLLFYLREIMEEKNVAVIIYSLTTTKPVVGKVDRAGLGKLPTIAMAIVFDAMSETLESAAPKPPALVIPSVDFMRAAEEGAQLLVSKINNLQGIKSPIPGERKNVKLKCKTKKIGDGKLRAITQ